MIVNKLLSIKKDNNVILYKVSFDDEKLYNFLDQLDERYSKVDTDIIETTFVGFKPISYGKYDSMNDICNIKELGIHDTKRERESKEYFKSLGGSSKEWEFLTEEEKEIFSPITGVHKAKLKLEIEYPSIIRKAIEDTFISDSKDDVIIDGTKLIKLGNHILGLSNNLKFDKTIDLKNKPTKWNDEAVAFFSVDDYNKYLNKRKRTINKDDVKITEKENGKLKHDIGEILYHLQNNFVIEQIGMYPIDLELSNEFEVLKRYAIRNETFEWLDRKLDLAPIDYDGRTVINEMSKQINQNYDIDGEKREQEIINKINSRKKEIDRLINFKESTKKEEPIIIPDDEINNLSFELIRKPKAA